MEAGYSASSSSSSAAQSSNAQSGSPITFGGGGWNVSVAGIGTADFKSNASAATSPAALGSLGNTSTLLIVGGVALLAWLIFGK